MHAKNVTCASANLLHTDYESQITKKQNLCMVQTTSLAQQKNKKLDSKVSGRDPQVVMYRIPGPTCRNKWCVCDFSSCQCMLLLFF
jgi:hypothetical protein